MKTQYQPVIIVGMHRSGTTMLTQIMQQLGLFLGWNMQQTQEAEFFLLRNERILNACGGSWYHPTVIDDLYKQPVLLQKIRDCLYHDLKSNSILSYLGPKLFFKYRYVWKVNQPWGWKDPRNTFLLPLWLQLFPEAKIIHIYRNGVDVAQSLVTREQMRIAEISSINSFKMRQRNLFSEKERRYLIYLYEKFYHIFHSFNPLHKYGRYKVGPCTTLDESFALWEVYMNRVQSHLEEIDNERLVIKYEDFLIDPFMHLQKMSDFCGLSNKQEEYYKIAQRVDASRGFNFLKNTQLRKMYEEKKKSLWMRELGYDSLN